MSSPTPICQPPCTSRAEAQRAGEMFYSLHAGWIFPAENRKPLGGLPLYRWSHCPFCSGRLPDVLDAVQPFLPPGAWGEGAE